MVYISSTNIHSKLQRLNHCQILQWLIILPAPAKRHTSYDTFQTQKKEKKHTSAMYSNGLIKKLK